ncbi:MAG: metal ABC transporter permease [Treponema sp.]|jgi:zinc transport system permease protein|nr:metal ABC transporter permease [Treponema sp.]
MLSLFAMPFFPRALVSLCAAGLAFPVLGTFVLNLELIPARFAVMHAALLGAALALIFNVNTMAAAMTAGVLAGIAIALISWRGRFSAGGTLGLIMTVCMGLAFIIFYKGNVHANEAFSLFWGNILTLTDADVRLLVCTAAAVLFFLATAYKEIHIVLYDRELAQAVGVRAKLVYAGIILSVCLGIAVAMRVSGALLVDAFTLLPALAARKVGRTFKALVLWGSVFGLVMNLGGFALSFAFDLPVSSAVVLVGAALIFAARLGRK